jgi:hypothetical protein
LSKDGLTATGTIYIYEGKKEKLVATYKNMIMNKSKMGLMNLWAGNDIGYGKIDYFVIGDGIRAVTPDDTRLEFEQFRKPISDITIYSANKIVIDTFVETDEANFDWLEIGLVSGGEWGIMGSGVLLNRAIIDEKKVSGLAKTISWEITLN